MSFLVVKMSNAKYLISIMSFWLIMPTLFILFNVSGYTNLDTTELQDITASDFNLFSLSGFGKVLNFIFGLGKYSFQGLHPLINILIVVIALASIILGVYLARGTN